MQLTNEKPSCFGEVWSPEDVECFGGLDPGYRNPATGRQMREQCECYEACGSHTQAKALEEIRTQLISRDSLRSPTQERTTTSTTLATQFKQPSPVLYPKHDPIRDHQLQRPAQPSMEQPVPQQQYMHPAQMMPVNYGMPAYLSTPEQRFDGEGFFLFALRVIVRAMLKGGAHGLAHLFDTTPLKK